MSKENPQVKFSPREEAIYRECCDEWALKRAFPLMVIITPFITSWAKTKNPKTVMIAFPAMVATIAITTTASFLHYKPTCEDKLLTLEPHGDVAKCKSKSGFSY